MGDVVERIGVLGLDDGHGGQPQRYVWMFDLDAFLSSTNGTHGSGWRLLYGINCLCRYPISIMKHTPEAFFAKDSPT